MKTFRELSVRRKASVVLLYTRMNIRIVLGMKSLWFLAGTALYFTIFYFVAANAEKVPTVVETLAWIVWLPTTLFAVLFSIEIISRERDAGVLETFFTVSVSVYRLWIIKFATLLLCLSMLAWTLIALTDSFFMDLPILLTLVYVLPPLVFFAGLSVLFSTLFRSATAAAVCMVAILAFVLLLAEGIATTPVFPYLNPFDKPFEVEPFIWARNVAYNKAAYLLLGIVWFWRALSRLNGRERLLK